MINIMQKIRAKCTMDLFIKAIELMFDEWCTCWSKVTTGDYNVQQQQQARISKLKGYKIQLHGYTYKMIGQTGKHNGEDVTCEQMLEWFDDAIIHVQSENKADLKMPSWGGSKK